MRKTTRNGVTFEWIFDITKSFSLPPRKEYWIDGKNKLMHVIVRFFYLNKACEAGSILRTADAFPVVPFLPPKNSGGREATTGNASAVRRLGRV